MAETRRALTRHAAPLAALALFTTTLTGCGLAREKLYAPLSGPIDTARWTQTHPQTVRVTTADGLLLTGYFWPGAPGDPDVVLFLHGRRAHQGVGAKYAQYLSGHGDAVLVVSYRGFGGNPGHPSRAGLEKDAAAFLAEARRRGGPQARLWLVGHSLGGGVALEAAQGAADVAGVVTIGTFARIAEAAPPLARPFVPDRWDNLTALRRVTAPVLILQGNEDRIIPTGSDARLAEAAAGPVASVRMTGVSHKPPMQTLGPWLSAAIASMATGHVASLPPLPAGWTAKVERP